jgi:hypothetical protein
MAWGTSKTWAVGDRLNAADVNAMIRDRLNYLTGTGWTDLVLINGWAWANGSWSKPGWSQLGDMIQLRGDITGGATGSQICNALPSSIWPPYLVVQQAMSNGTHGRIDVGLAGTVTWSSTWASSTNAYVMLDQVRWFIN